MTITPDPNIEILIKLLVATFLGALIGLERERSHKAAGLRTHALVSLGSALLTILSLYMVNVINFENYDPSRIISNIIVGIGFIGGGAILRSGFRITGTTTAASLWIVAAIGIATGVGFYYGAIVTAIIAYFLLTVVWKLEKRFATVSSQQSEGNSALGDVIVDESRT